MMERIGEPLEAFERALDAFRGEAARFPEVSARLFEGSRDWIDLLTYKLVPHLAGEGCLVAVVAGGTNTGKSTIFNVLAGVALSPVVNTAAATCHPVLAANERRRAQCLQAKLVPEFAPLPLGDGGGPTDREATATALYVGLASSLPDHLVIMDTPDVDSIDTRNWEIADHIRAAGDVMLALITGEKYRDERVVAFFREALAAGRLVLPVMNKANPANDFDVARKQLAEFMSDTRAQGPCFVVGHDFDIASKPDVRVAGIDGGPDLREYLETRDVAAIKESVFGDTVRKFAASAGEFVDLIDSTARDIRAIIRDMESSATKHAAEYDPAPGSAVGGLFHEFVQSKRGPVRRMIGSASTTLFRGVSAVGKRISGALLKRIRLEGGDADENIEERHARQAMQLARECAARCIERAGRSQGPLRGMLSAAVDAFDTNTSVQAAAAGAAVGGPVSETFRAHAMRTLDAWWEDHKNRRKVLEGLDVLLAAMPAAIAAPISLYTGGVGASEAVVFIGPIAAQFVTRVMEYQFGDAMFDFLSPWKREQQARLAESLKLHVVRPLTRELEACLAVLEGEHARELRRRQAECR